MKDNFSVVTIVKNRTQQLSNLIHNLEQTSMPPSELVVVWMAPPSDNSLIQSKHFCIKHKFATSEELPLALARNRGFSACENTRIVHLDVDCVCDPELFGHMMQNWQDKTIYTTHIQPVNDMPEDATFDALQARKDLFARRTTDRTTGSQPFQSTVFALDKASFDAVNGFDEHYHGFGIGDIDFATRCASVGISTHMLDYVTFNQHRANYQYPINHLLDIVTNANLYKTKWGYYPATNWLSAFMRAGFINENYEHTGLCIKRMPTEDEIFQALHSDHPIEDAANLEKMSA